MVHGSCSLSLVVIVCCYLARRLLVCVLILIYVESRAGRINRSGVLLDLEQCCLLPVIHVSVVVHLLYLHDLGS